MGPVFTLYVYFPHRLTRSHRITVSPWANYTFRVIAQNDIGWSRPSVPTQSVCEMPPDVPRHNPRRVCTLNEKANELVIAWRVSLLHGDLKRLKITKL